MCEFVFCLRPKKGDLLKWDEGRRHVVDQDRVTETETETVTRTETAKGAGRKRNEDANVPIAAAVVMIAILAEKIAGGETTLFVLCSFPFFTYVFVFLYFCPKKIGCTEMGIGSEAEMVPLLIPTLQKSRALSQWPPLRQKPAMLEPVNVRM